jgi:hypothetical protein
VRRASGRRSRMIAQQARLMKHEEYDEHDTNYDCMA